MTKFPRIMRRVAPFAILAAALAALAIPRPQLDGGARPIQVPATLMRLPDALSFCGEAVPLDEPHIRIAAEREFYLMLQDAGQLILNIKRSGIFFPMFERVAMQDTVPQDLKYIAVIESALRNARSSKDAYGIWQFIEPTAKRFGLQVDKDVDERLNIDKATHAAYMHIKEGHDMFGSWTMGCAGYNMGPQNLAEQAAYQRDSNFYRLYLNEETSRYIFRAAVMKEIMEHPQRYGLPITEGDEYRPDSLVTVTEDSAVPDLETWAVAHGTTYRWVKTFNPWILKRDLPRPRGAAWEIKIPGWK